MSARSSYLVSQKNLVVEGPDDFWVLTELSELFDRSGMEGINEAVMITAAGGASEAVYLTTFMLGQGLDVATLFDSDGAGQIGHDKLVKGWLDKYKWDGDKKRKVALLLGEVLGIPGKDFTLEDIFPEGEYTAFVEEAYRKELGGNKLNLTGSDGIVARIERALSTHQIGIFNKGRVAKIIKRKFAAMATVNDLWPDTKQKVEVLIRSINQELA